MQRLLFCLITTLFFTSSAFAGDWYFGGKVGSVLVDLDDSSNPQNIGIIGGWEQGIVLGDLGLEADITRTTSDGELGNDDLAINTIGLYGVYRTPGFVYFKAKAGVVREDTTLSNSAAPDTETNDTGSSIGLGIGFSLKLIKFEIEFTSIEKDADYLSLAVRF